MEIVSYFIAIYCEFNESLTMVHVVLQNINAIYRILLELVLTQGRQIVAIVAKYQNIMGIVFMY